MKFKKDCSKCGEKFIPNSSAHKLCYKCLDNAKNNKQKGQK